MRKGDKLEAVDGKNICRIDAELLSGNGNQVQPWRVFKILAELVAGFELLRKYSLAATFFGTSRCKSTDEVYRQAEELAGKLAKAGFAIVTGGASGVMEAANKGAYEAGGKSIGVNIRLPEKQGINEYLTDFEQFNYFFTRKVMLSFASEVYVFLPGGFGTLDEFFEMVTLVQTKKIKRIPIIAIGKGYWAPLFEWVEKTVVEKNQAADKEDLNIYYLVDSVDEAYNLILKLVPECNPRP
jgi:uncharacterized protein (TIGR00730 family)